MAQVDYFLKITGIEGESPDTKHKKEIEISSFSWGASNSGSAAFGGGHGSGKVSFQDFHFTLKLCKASPKLMLACANGEHIKDAILTCRKAGKEQQEYLIVKFTSVLISSYQTGGSAGDIIPMDSCSFNFNKIEVEYKEQKEDGSLGGTVKAHYDMKAAKGG